MKNDFSINEKPEGLDDSTAEPVALEARHRAFLQVFGSAFVDNMIPKVYGGGGVQIGDMRTLCRRAYKTAFEEIIKDLAKERFKVELQKQFQELSRLDTEDIEALVKVVEARGQRKEYEKDFY